jgi:hypothetical protein
MTRPHLRSALLASLAACACAPTPPSERHPYRAPPPGCARATPEFDEDAGGLYWLGLGGSECLETGDANPNFDPGRPTVVLFHGWKYGKTRAGDPLTLTDARFAPDAPHLADAWLMGGWNVGIFRWTQHADELLPADAESKIWSTEVAPGMRWRRADGGVEFDPERGTIGDRATRALLTSLSRWRGDELRVVGHSLGSQVATQVTARLHAGVRAGRLPERVRPGRLALLDPFWSAKGRVDLTPYPFHEYMEVTLARMIEEGLALEVHTASLLNVYFFHPEHASRRMGAWLDYHPDFITHFTQHERHDALVWHYFASWAHGPARACDGAAALPSSAADDEVIKAWMGRDAGVRQLEGKPTADPADDCYEVHTR